MKKRNSSGFSVYCFMIMLAVFTLFGAAFVHAEPASCLVHEWKYVRAYDYEKGVIHVRKFCEVCYEEDVYEERILDVARTVDVPSVTSIELEEGIREWLVFDVTEACCVDIWSVSDEDTVGTLFAAGNPNLSYIDEEDDNYTDYNFRITRYLEPGTYVLETRFYGSGSGTMAVSIRQSNVCEEEGHNWEEGISYDAATNEEIYLNRCTQCGLSEEKRAPHLYHSMEREYGEFDSDGIGLFDVMSCQFCGVEEKTPHEHVLSADGYFEGITYTEGMYCSNCQYGKGKTYDITKAAVPYDWENGSVVLAGCYDSAWIYFSPDEDCAANIRAYSGLDTKGFLYTFEDGAFDFYRQNDNYDADTMDFGMTVDLYAGEEYYLRVSEVHADPSAIRIEIVAQEDDNDDYCDHRWMKSFDVDCEEGLVIYHNICTYCRKSSDEKAVPYDELNTLSMEQAAVIPMDANLRGWLAFETEQNEAEFVIKAGDGNEIYGVEIYSYEEDGTYSLVDDGKRGPAVRCQLPQGKYLMSIEAEYGREDSQILVVMEPVNECRRDEHDYFRPFCGISQEGSSDLYDVQQCAVCGHQELRPHEHSTNNNGIFEDGSTVFRNRIYCSYCDYSVQDEYDVLERAVSYDGVDLMMIPVEENASGWIIFTAGENDHVKIRGESGIDTVAELYLLDEDGTESITGNDDGYGSDFYIDIDLTAGSVYLLRVMYFDPDNAGVIPVRIGFGEDYELPVKECDHDWVEISSVHSAEGEICYYDHCTNCSENRNERTVTYGQLDKLSVGESIRVTLDKYEKCWAAFEIDQDETDITFRVDPDDDSANGAITDTALYRCEDDGSFSEAKDFMQGPVVRYRLPKGRYVIGFRIFDHWGDNDPSIKMELAADCEEDEHNWAESPDYDEELNEEIHRIRCTICGLVRESRNEHMDHLWYLQDVKEGEDSVLYDYLKCTFCDATSTQEHVHYMVKDSSIYCEDGFIYFFEYCDSCSWERAIKEASYSDLDVLSMNGSVSFMVNEDDPRAWVALEVDDDETEFVIVPENCNIGYADIYTCEEDGSFSRTDYDQYGNVLRYQLPAGKYVIKIVLWGWLNDIEPTVSMLPASEWDENEYYDDGGDHSWEVDERRVEESAQGDEVYLKCRNCGEEKGVTPTLIEVNADYPEDYSPENRFFLFKFHVPEETDLIINRNLYGNAYDEELMNADLECLEWISSDSAGVKERRQYHCGAGDYYYCICYADYWGEEENGPYVGIYDRRYCAAHGHDMMDLGASTISEEIFKENHLEIEEVCMHCGLRNMTGRYHDFYLSYLDYREEYGHFGGGEFYAYYLCPHCNTQYGCDLGGTAYQIDVNTEISGTLLDAMAVYIKGVPLGNGKVHLSADRRFSYELHEYNGVVDEVVLREENCKSVDFEYSFSRNNEYYILIKDKSDFDDKIMVDVSLYGYDGIVGEAERIFDFILMSEDRVSSVYASAGDRVRLRADIWSYDDEEIDYDAFTYRWYKNGVLIPDATGPEYEVSVQTADDFCTYSLVIPETDTRADRIAIRNNTERIDCIVEGPDHVQIGDKVTLTAVLYDYLGNRIEDNAQFSYEWHAYMGDYYEEIEDCVANRNQLTFTVTEEHMTGRYSCGLRYRNDWNTGYGNLFTFNSVPDPGISLAYEEGTLIASVPGDSNATWYGLIYSADNSMPDLETEGRVRINFLELADDSRFFYDADSAPAGYYRAFAVFSTEDGEEIRYSDTVDIW